MTVTNKYKVSVIIPAFNAAEYLQQCLDSICAQTLREIQIIVVDDGSTDATLEILQKYAAADDRFKILTQNRGFAGPARNKGLQAASGEFVSFLDADDFFAPTMLAEMYQNAQQNSSDIVLCRSNSYNIRTKKTYPIDYAIKFVQPGQVYSSDDLVDVMFQFCVGWPWDKLYRRSFLDNTGLEYPPLRTSEDAYFVFMSLILAQRITLVDKDFVTHRIGNTNSNENSRKDNWDDALVAEDMIEKSLLQRGLFEKYRQAYLAWILDFNIWNFSTLMGKPKQQFYWKMMDKLERYNDYPTKNKLFHAYQEGFYNILKTRSYAKAYCADWLPMRLKKVIF